MKYFLVHGQIDKVEPYTKALDKHGYVRTKDWRDADFVLFDFVRGGEHRIRFQEIYSKRTCPIYAYPHAALGMYMWDGLIANLVPVTCKFTFSEGQRQVLQAYGYPYQSMAAGWSYSKVLSFAPSQDVKRILFAPKHPNGEKEMVEEDRKLNKLAFDRLCNLGIPMTVYYGHDLKNNGLSTCAGVEYVRSKLTLAGAEEQILSHDLVVAHDTFAYTAIALGKPTLMFVGDQCPHANGRRVLHYEAYRDIVKYPLDIADWQDTAGLVSQAVASDRDIAAWKERMIGKPFDEDSFVASLQEIHKWAAWPTKEHL